MALYVVDNYAQTLSNCKHFLALPREHADRQGLLRELSETKNKAWVETLVGMGQLERWEVAGARQDRLNREAQTQADRANANYTRNIASYQPAIADQSSRAVRETYELEKPIREAAQAAEAKRQMEATAKAEAEARQQARLKQEYRDNIAGLYREYHLADDPAQKKQTLGKVAFALGVSEAEAADYLGNPITANRLDASNIVGELRAKRVAR